ncbi:GNAT family N-acetyltransferase [Novosphingobium guangzhouense]|uniref:GCN5 family acetyltransferase n=1 Tax=Novosphingobium guangzhouense TaxID=1850347 RepID=A0A2K2G5S6_9SPHN|nr:GNAT family N-acetyltransferase [Novosphingobium guangzhouense]PNU06389.1 GCN5 family acetyltransferase [Novosphingobium guangzhouense]
MGAQLVSGLQWRAMRASDIDGVVDVARASFPDHFEARACFEERLALFAQGCSVLADPADEAVRGYLIAYPWPLGAIPPLDSLLGSVPQARTAYYLHDLALHPDVRGQGHASPAVRQLFAVLRGLGGDEVALVSVNDTAAFWQGQGFAAVPPDAALQRKLASYGPDARYMRRAL